MTHECEDVYLAHIAAINVAAWTEQLHAIDPGLTWGRSSHPYDGYWVKDAACMQDSRKGNCWSVGKVDGYSEPSFHSLGIAIMAFLRALRAASTEFWIGAPRGPDPAASRPPVRHVTTIIDSDNGPGADRLSIMVDDQGDYYIGTLRNGERTCMHATRFCGPGGGCHSPAIRMAVALLEAVARQDKARIIDRAEALLRLAECFAGAQPLVVDDDDDTTG